MNKMFANPTDWVLFFSIAVQAKKDNKSMEEAKEWLVLYSQKNNFPKPSDVEMKYLINEVNEWLEKFDENWSYNLINR